MTLHRFLITRAFGQSICRLGLASYPGTALTPNDVHAALERGINFLSWLGLADASYLSDDDPIPAAIASLGVLRRSVVVCVQFGARTKKDAATELRSVLSRLGTEFIDVVTLYYVERPTEWEQITAPDGALPYLQDAKRAGTVRHIGITSHQRPLAATMAASGLLDTIMIRYNAAHRGAEREVFPVTQARALSVISYTALRWGALLQSSPDDPPGFVVPSPTAWYRFVLQHPAVAVTLCGPQTRAELDEDLRVLDATGPLTDSEYAALAAHGDRVRIHAGSFR
jgi:aryl-alcohol dehydrogenase-like predicted oxidoreductase